MDDHCCKNKAKLQLYMGFKPMSGSVLLALELII